MIEPSSRIVRLTEEKKERYIRAFSRNCLLFLRALWGRAGSVFFTPFARFHEYIIERINKTKKLIILIMVPRRFGKTKLVSFGYLVWAIAFGRYSYVLHISYSLKEKGEQIMRDLQRGFKSPIFIRIFGDWQGKFWGQHKIHLYSEKWKIDCVIEVRGIDQSIFGASEWKFRPDLIVMDDVEDLKSVRNKDLINNMIDKFKTEIIPAAESKDEKGRKAKIIIIGTPLAPYTFLTELTKKEWREYVELLKFSALVDSRKIPRMGEILGLPEDSSIWEARWTTEEMQKERQFWIDTNSYTTWLSQYMMDPVTASPMQFDPEKLIEIDFKEIQKDIPKNKVICCVDMAYTERTQNDATGINVSLHKKGSKIVSLESHEMRVTVDKLFDFLCELRTKYEKAGEYITAIETRQFQLIKQYFWERETRTGKHLELMALEDRNRNKENDRIAAMIPFYEVGLLEFVKTENRPLLGQMWTWFGKTSGKDDILDAFSYQRDFVEISEEADVGRKETEKEEEETGISKELYEELPDKYSAKATLKRYDLECEEKRIREEENESDDFDFDGW